jgi:hypothetical protein
MTDDTSTVTENPDTPSPEPVSSPAPSTAGTAESSPSQGEPDSKGESREDLLSVITKAANPVSDAPDETKDPSQQGATPAQDKDPKKDQSSDEIPEDELRSYRPGVRKRIDKLLEDRRTLRVQLENAERGAAGTRELQKFLHDADITRDDFGLTLDLAVAMRKGNYQAFLAGVEPYVRLAQEALGLTLPPDLQQAVAQGHMTDEAARYTSQTRYARISAEATAERLQSQRNTETQQRELVDFQSRIANVVTQWEKGIKAKDPDYGKKEAVVRDLLPAVVQELGVPRNETEAIAIAEAAYARANQIAGRFQPPPRQTNLVPSSIARVNGAVPAPTSMLEAAKQALERSR